MSAGNFIGGLIVGTAVGLATGLLIAPSSGNQTRRNIVRKSKVYSQQAVDAVRQYLETLRQRGKHSDSLGDAEDILSQVNTEQRLY